MTQPLSWGQLLAILVATCQDLPDQRTGKNRQHTIRDAALGAFGVFFTQTPCFLARQRDMQRRKGCNNAQSLCGVAHIPSDPQIRNLLAPIAPAYLRPPFWAVRQRLAEVGALKDYHSFNGGLCARWMARSILLDAGALCAVYRHREGDRYPPCPYGAHSGAGAAWPGRGAGHGTGVHHAPGWRRETGL